MRDVANLRVECSIQWRVYEEERVCLLSMHVGAKETEREREKGVERERCVDLRSIKELRS